MDDHTTFNNSFLVFQDNSIIRWETPTYNYFGESDELGFRDGHGITIFKGESPIKM